MKFPSIIKTPKYQRFNIEPRYYDPVKEEIEQRTSQIKKDLELEAQRTEGDFTGGSSSKLRGAFKTKRAKARGMNMTQAAIFVLLASGAFGYIYYGNIALYIFLTVSSLLLYLRIKGKI